MDSVAKAPNEGPNAMQHTPRPRTRVFVLDWERNAAASVSASSEPTARTHKRHLVSTGLGKATTILS